MLLLCWYGQNKWQHFVANASEVKPSDPWSALAVSCKYTQLSLKGVQSEVQSEFARIEKVDLKLMISVILRSSLVRRLLPICNPIGTSHDNLSDCLHRGCVVEVIVICIVTSVRLSWAASQGRAGSPDEVQGGGQEEGKG